MELLIDFLSLIFKLLVVVVKAITTLLNILGFLAITAYGKIVELIFFNNGFDNKMAPSKTKAQKIDKMEKKWMKFFSKKNKCCKTKCHNKDCGCETMSSFIFSGLRIQIRFIKKLEQQINELGRKQKDESLTEMLQEFKSKKSHIKIIKKSEFQVKEIENLLNRKPSMNQLIDTFLFGSEREKVVFEDLCSKWTIKNWDQMGLDEERSSGKLPIYGYDFRIKVVFKKDANDNHYFDLRFSNKDLKNQKLNKNILPMVILIIKDSSQSDQKKHIISYHDFPFQNSSTIINKKFNYQTCSAHKSFLDNLVSSKNRSLDVLLLVEPLPIIKNAPTDGIISNTYHYYDEKIQLGLKKWLYYSQWSSSFITQAGEYRVAVALSLKGTESDYQQVLTAFVVFLPGKFGIQLPCEWNHQTTITLIHPADAKKNITVKKRSARVDGYEMTIAPIGRIKYEKFNFNNSLNYRAVVHAE